MEDVLTQHRSPATQTAMISAAEWRIAGFGVMLAALLFWLSWYLMPQPGTTDARYILGAVALVRGRVLLSAVLQTLSAVAIVPGMLAVVRLPRGPGYALIYAGAFLSLTGAMGNAADAVYHQVAFEMTAPGVDRGSMVPVMTRLQTQDIRLLAPLMLCFFAGAVCLSAGLGRAGVAPRRLWLIYVVALLVGAGGRIAVRMAGPSASARPIALTVLGLFSVGLGWAGCAMTDRARRLRSNASISSR